MKLVGATNWFIRVPFMLEGLFAALAGALLSGAAIWAANEWLFPRVARFAEFLGPVFDFSSSEITGVLLLMLGTGLAVGLLGSGMALRRFLEA